MMKREKETEEYRATVIILRNNGTHIFIKSLLLRSKKKERKKERERERERVFEGEREGEFLREKEGVRERRRQRQS